MASARDIAQAALEQGMSLCDSLWDYRETLEANVPDSYPDNGEVTYHLERYSTRPWYKQKEPKPVRTPARLDGS